MKIEMLDEIREKHERALAHTDKNNILPGVVGIDPPGAALDPLLNKIFRKELLECFYPPEYPSTFPGVLIDDFTRQDNHSLRLPGTNGRHYNKAYICPALRSTAKTFRMLSR